MSDVLSGNPVARALGIALLQFVWQGAALAALTALALQVLRRHSSNARYVVGCLGLLAMFTAPIVTAATSSSSFNVTAVRHDMAATSDNRTLAGGTAPAGLGAPDRGSLAGSLSRFWNSSFLERQLPVIVAVWAFGVLLFTLQLAGSWLLVERIRRGATCPLARVSDAYLRDAAARLNVTRPLRLAQSSRVDVPTVIGWIRPLILVPSSAMAGLSPFQLEAIIAHEIAHVRRHDYVVNVLQSLVETLLFYHPAVWWVSRQIRLEREHCCDDVAAEVCGDRVAYARALASMEELRADTPRLALAANGGDLVTRIRRLLGRPQPAAPRPTWMAIGLAVATVLLVFAGGQAGRASTTVDPGASTLLGAGPSMTFGARAASLNATPLAAAPAVPQQPVSAQAPRDQPQALQVMQVQRAEGQFHVAKQRNDAAALTQLMDDEFVGTDQNGATRSKGATIDLYRTTIFNSVSQGNMAVRAANDMAVVTGSSEEVTGTRSEQLLFTHVWRKDAAGAWKLVSSSQFRDPRIASSLTADLLAQVRAYERAMIDRSIEERSGSPTAPLSVPRDPIAALSPGQPVRIGGDIKEPRKLVDVKPVYPQIALAAKVQGIVIMELVIDEQGNVMDARVLRSQPLLDQAALDAVTQWKFMPTSLNGVAVQVKMTVTVNFSLPQ